ncbi:thermonuclease family protein [Oceanibacterium hippocampi]|uniref:thermonuclease family protein n=1 Tax=Oceanibacterium hippocampi TaxID=745714 RepID=UPI000A26A018|nr:thermonuclease family protein [Oceanibacterium hippocampi]
MPARFARIALLAGAVAVAGPALAQPAPAEPPLSAWAQVTRVIDGDTFRADVRIWIDLTLSTAVRVRGVDTPEIHGRCPAEKQGAARARDFAAAFLAAGPALLSDVENGKYAGRVVATVSVGGRDLAEALIAARLGRRYDGHGRRLGWCE